MCLSFFSPPQPFCFCFLPLATVCKVVSQCWSDQAKPLLMPTYAWKRTQAIDFGTLTSYQVSLSFTFPPLPISCVPVFFFVSLDSYQSCVISCMGSSLTWLYIHFSLKKLDVIILYTRCSLCKESIEHNFIVTVLNDFQLK